MSTSDIATLHELERRVGRSFGYQLEGECCVALDLTSSDELYHGLVRKYSCAEKEEVLGLICKLTALKRLNLRRNKLGRLPPAFSNLAELESLNLGSNCLGVVPDSLRSLRKLKFLHLGNNGLAEIPGFLGEFEQLEYLTLHKNVQVKSITPLADLRNLRHLNLHYLNLHKLPAFIYRFQHLETLTVWNISEFSDELEKLNQLQYFSDCGCPGLRRLPEALTSLKQLRMMRLFQNSLEELPESFGNLEYLEQLSLYQNRLRDLPRSFSRLKKLWKLNLGWNDFRLVPECLRDCSALEWLGVFENPLKHIDHSPRLPPHTLVLRTRPFTTLPARN